jgi:hypothetical protein
MLMSLLALCVRRKDETENKNQIFDNLASNRCAIEHQRNNLMNQLDQGTQQELVEKMWEEHRPDIEQQKVEFARRFLKYNAQFKVGASSMSGEEVHCEFADKLTIAVFEAVKSALGHRILMELSEPSRFEVIYVETLIACGAEIKRSMVHEFQDELDKKNLGATYDIELDIKETEEELRRIIELKFKFEMLFWSALDEGKFQEASAFLHSMELSRVGSSEALKIEVLNWRINLSLSMNDVAMFMEIFAKALSFQEQFSEFKSAIAQGVRKLVCKNVLSGIKMKLSDFGITQARKSEKTIQDYFGEQTEVFLNGAFLEIVDCLCKNPRLGLFEMSVVILSSRRVSHLAINPCLDDIVLVSYSKCPATR